MRASFRGFETVGAWAQAHEGKFRFFRDGLVQAVITAMGCDDFHGPLAIPVAHVFGETSHRNPFLRGDAGVSADWDRMYPRHSVDFLPCGHGQYFSGPVLPALVDILIRRLNLA
jgi:hypothetical protein